MQKRELCIHKWNEEMMGVMVRFTILIVVMFTHHHTGQKFIQLDTLKMWTLLYIDYTQISKPWQSNSKVCALNHQSIWPQILQNVLLRKTMLSLFFANILFYIGE